MSMYIWGAAFVGGVVVGLPFWLFLAGMLPAGYGGRGAARVWLRWGLSMGDRWTLHQSEGKEYELLHLTEAEDHPNGLVDDDERMFEDVGLLGHLEFQNQTVPFGLTFDQHRAVTNPVAARIGEEYGKLKTDSPIVDQQAMTDGGQPPDDDNTVADPFEEEKPLNYYRENALLARGVDGGRMVEVVNGAVDIPAAAVADVKETVRVLKHAGDPEQPKRAAENAENAERARSDRSGLWYNIERFVWLFLGGLMVFIGSEVMGDSGGGGGGGGPDVPGPDVSGMIDVTPAVDALATTGPQVLEVVTYVG